MEYWANYTTAYRYQDVAIVSGRGLLSEKVSLRDQGKQVNGLVRVCAC